MDGFGHLSPPPCREAPEPRRPRVRASSARSRRPGAPLDPTLCCWTKTGVTDQSEEAPSWSARRRSPSSQRPRRRRRSHVSPRESHSFTDLSRRPSAERAKKHRACSRRMDDAWRETRPRPPLPQGSQHSPSWLSPSQLRSQQPQPCPKYTRVPRDSPSPPGPEASYTSLTGALEAEKKPGGDKWAVRVCRGLDRCSLSSILTDKSSAPSQEGRVLPAFECSRKRASTDSQCSQHSMSSKDTQVLKSQLEEAIVSSRDEKIVALVLSRLKKAQKMRELQQQTAVAWEELKASDHQVQKTLEKERQLLLQQSQDQWQRAKEPRKALLKRETRKLSRASAQDLLRPPNEKLGRTSTQNLVSQRLEQLQRNRSLAEHRKLCQEQRLQEQEKMLQGVREFSNLQLQTRLEQASQRKNLYTLEGQKKLQETNTSSLVNYQARKVLMDCQAKAEELLRKLSLEQSCQRSQDLHRNLMKERQRELQERVQREEEQFQQVKCRAQEFEDQKKAQKQLLMELANQKIRRARTTVHRNIQNKAQHVRDLNIQREKNHHVLKLKAEKEEKCHIEGIKEAIRKKEQKIEQISRQKEAALEQLQRSSKALRREGDSTAQRCSFFSPKVQETQLCACQHRDY
ncbi:coiled-coil domain-containing protein 185 [Suncus etruscus]|uniref:coiled-coil domain-containing protein 185 n=1 Tax=Suncus etruscus TaxID=109475 RepID=UPI00210F31F2|nr:coiled-coil domain-containing protein 185 [Suncus etruscus]